MKLMYVAIEILSTILNIPIIVEMDLFDSHTINYDRFNDWNDHPALRLILRGQNYHCVLVNCFF
jgi:hypothetical protein